MQLEQEMSLDPRGRRRPTAEPEPDLARQAERAAAQQELLAVAQRPQRATRFTGRGQESCWSSRVESLARMRPPQVSVPGYRILGATAS